MASRQAGSPARGKRTSRRIAAIASRIASGGDFSISEARAVAASCVAQAERERPAETDAETARERCS